MRGLLQRLFDRLNLHVEHNKIPLSVFWTSSRLCLTFDEFVDLFSNVPEFRLMEPQMQLLRQEVEFVSIEEAINGSKYWLATEKSVTDFLGNASRLSEMGVIASGSSQSSPIKSGKFIPKSEKEYLKEHKFKAISNEVRLNETLIRTQQESDYQLTVKVAEANDICRQLKNQTTYLLNTTGQGLVIVESQGKTNKQAQITRKIFLKEYEKLKTASYNAIDQIEGNLEQDLRKTLVEIMYLSSELESQIKLFQDKQIGH